MREHWVEGQCSAEMQCFGKVSRFFWLEGPAEVNWCWDPQSQARWALRVRGVYLVLLESRDQKAELWNHWGL